MSRFERITLSEVDCSALETFYEHQLDQEAIRVAAFVCKDPKDEAAFDQTLRVIMIRIWAVAVMTCLVAGCRLGAGGAGQRTTPTGAPVAAARDAVVAVENEWGRALVETNVSAFGRCLADEWRLTTSGGSTVTKSMALADLASGALRIESFRLEDVGVRVYGDTAIVFGLITEKSSFRGTDTSGRRRFTDVFVKRDGRWQAVASHESSVH